MTDGARAVVGTLCVVVLLGIAVPAAGQPTPGGQIGDVSISGGGVVAPTETGNGSTYLWRAEPTNVTVAFADSPDALNYRVCLGYEREDAPTARLTPECDQLSLSAGTNGTAEFGNVTWPANVTGQRQLTAELQRLSNESDTRVLDRKTVPVTVLRKQGDFDSDGLTNEREVEAGYNLSNPDMDSDLLSDGEEVNKYDSDPRDPDTDGDGIRDGEEVQSGTDPTEADTDGDGLPDDVEATLGTNPTNDLTPVWLAATALLVGGALAGAFVFARRRWRERSDAATVAPNGSHAEPATDTAADAPDPTADRDPAPLTDEDRIRTLLRNHGGRMKQSRIVEETDWSKAKVSRVLSTMTDEGSVDKLSIGRENVISLDGHRPEAARPPAEENASD